MKGTEGSGSFLCWETWPSEIGPTAHENQHSLIGFLVKMPMGMFLYLTQKSMPNFSWTTNHVLRKLSKTLKCNFKKRLGTTLIVPWLRLWTSNAGGVGAIPGWGTKIPHAVRYSRKNKMKIKIDSMSVIGTQDSTMKPKIYVKENML